MKQRIKIITIILLVMTVSFCVQKSHSVQAATKGTVTADSLNVRTGAGTDKPLLMENNAGVALKKGDTVTINETADGWNQVSFSYNGKTLNGYVKAEYIKVKAVTLNIPGKVIRIKKLPLRKSASKKAERIKSGGKNVSIAKNAEVKILSEKRVGSQKWYRISVLVNEKRVRGYVLSKYIKLDLSKKYVQAAVTAKTVKIRKKGDSSAAYLKVSGKAVSLQKGQEVKIIKEITDAKGKKWYRISFTYEEKTKKGYVLASKLELQKRVAKKATPSNPVEEPSPKPVDFEAYMTEQGFPESYKPYLRTLHEKYPNWTFEAYQTGLKWNTVLENESKVGLNLVNKIKGGGWLSYESGAYSWYTDTFTIFDGTYWVSASKEAIAYYMDPRNFLTQMGIFQFESLGYQEAYQTQSGVEQILKRTPMSETKFSYSKDGKNAEILYSQAFIEAAKESNVSPYHLATRVKQEVVTSATTFSGSATGTYSGYEGYFNFYNIGAYHSAGGGAVANGLSYAKKTNDSYLLPWNDRYKAIVGGAMYIGKSYINKGQNSIYLQKFNVTPTSTYSHQYMANIEAANAEAIKSYYGYTDLLDSPIVFSIPVYEEMPEEACPIPSAVANPNNWLKTLRLGSYTLTPTFSADVKNYTLSVGADVESLKLTAVPVNSSATMKLTANGKTTALTSGSATSIALSAGSNVIKVKVQAANGKSRTYKITVTKG